MIVTLCLSNTISGITPGLLLHEIILVRKLLSHALRRAPSATAVPSPPAELGQPQLYRGDEEKPAQPKQDYAAIADGHVEVFTDSLYK